MPENRVTSTKEGLVGSARVPPLREGWPSSQHETVSPHFVWLAQLRRRSSRKRKIEVRPLAHLFRAAVIYNLSPFSDPLRGSTYGYDNDSCAHWNPFARHRQ
jgi:hypothetical protein